MLKRNLLALCFITILSAFFVSKVGSASTEINDKGAAHLKGIFTDFIDTHKKTQEIKGHELITEGDVTVEQAEEYYAITLPAMTFSAPDKSKIQIGFIAVNASPGEKKDEWKMSISLPTPFLITGPKGEELKLDIGKQQAGGIWNDTLGSFASMAMIYDNISLNNPQSQELATLDLLVLQSKYEEEKSDKWSGFGKATAKNLIIGNATTPMRVSVGSFSVNADIDDYDPNSFVPLKDNLVSKLDNIKKLEQTKGKGDPAVKKQAQEFATFFLDKFLNSFDKSTMTLSLQDIQANGTDKTTGKTETIQLKSVLFNYGLDGMKSEDGNVNALLSMSYDGLIPPPNKPNFELVPTKFKTQLALNSLPLDKIIAMAKSPKDPQQSKAARQAQIKDLLTKAGTNIATQDSHIGNNHYHAHIKGKLQAQTSAAQGVVGNMTVTTKQLESLIGQLQQQAAAIPPATQGQAMMLIKGLAFLNMFSMPQSDDSKVAKFALDEVGNITINGNNISALIGANVQPSQGGE